MAASILWNRKGCSIQGLRFVVEASPGAAPEYTQEEHQFLQSATLAERLSGFSLALEEFQTYADDLSESIDIFVSED